MLRWKRRFANFVGSVDSRPVAGSSLFPVGNRKSQSSFLSVAFAIEGRLIHDKIREVLANNIATYQSEELPIEAEEQRSED